MENLKTKERQQRFNRGKVSVVTPVFNGEYHLPAMLESILMQSYPDIEMILVDDGSVDHTVQIAENYREKFEERGYSFRIVQTCHKSASAAINEGLPYVTGEYLIWPDSDDKLEPESVRRRVEFLKANPEYRCVRTLSYYYDQLTGELLNADEQIGDLSDEYLFWNILESKTYVCCGCYMLISEYFFQIYPNRHIPEYDVGQNFQMLLPFMFRYKCPTIPEKLYGVCVRKGSHSRTELNQKQEEKKYCDYEDLIDEIAAICEISDKVSQRRILSWKARRRYMIALKYKQKKQIIAALFMLYRCKELNIFRVLKDSLWICLDNTWVIKVIYPKIRKIRYNRKHYQ